MQGTLKVMTPPEIASVRLPVQPRPEAWILTEGIVPQAPIHHDVALALELLLRVWAARSPQRLRICGDIAIRFYERDQRVGIDPDVCVLANPPEDLDDVASLCLWRPGHLPPLLCFEIVSVNHPHKDYREIQERYAALGTQELVVFDPLLVGPKSLGGPVSLQLWRRDGDRAFTRVHFGNDPVYSEVLGAWVIADGRALHIADQSNGEGRWQNEIEDQAARAAQNGARAEREAENAKREAENAKREAENAKREAARADALAQELAALKATLAKK